MKDTKLLKITEDILNNKKISLNVRDFKSFKNLKLDTDTSTITGAGKEEPTGADNSVQCADAQRYYNEIIKISESLENKFSENKARIKNYETASNTLSTTKRSVMSAKENYSDKEKKWFEEFINLK